MPGFPKNPRYRRCTTGKPRRSVLLYGVWTHMKIRCNAPHRKEWANYGGRGIRVCDEWVNDYDAFRQWAIDNGFRKGLTLDRIDTDGNYCPENCRWLSRQQQNENKKNNRLITYNGDTLPASVMAKKYGLLPEQLHQRLRQGWSIKKSLTTPINAQCSSHGNRRITREQILWARANRHLPGPELAKGMGLTSPPYALSIARGDRYGDIS